MKRLQCYTINGAFLSLIYAGWFGGYQWNEYAQNALLFFSWLTVVLSLFFLSGDVAKSVFDKGRSVTQSENIVFDMCVALIFASIGYPVLATFWVIHLFIFEGSYAWYMKKNK